MKRRGKGRVRRSSLRAFGIRTDVIFDFFVFRTPQNCSGPLPACASFGSAQLQELLGRGRSVGSGAPWFGVYLIDPWGGTTALWLETSMFWLLHPGAVIGTQTTVVPMNSVDWRAKKGQFDVMTERTRPNLKSSNRAKYTREYVDLCEGQTRPQRGHTYTYQCSIEIRLLLRNHSDGQN